MTTTPSSRDVDPDKPARIRAGEVREPLRIVVAGNSTSLFVTPARQRRSDGTYGELLPRMLGEHGVRAEVMHTGQWFDLINDLRRRYEHAIRNYFPDVLILNYGMGEAQPNVVPTWMARHFQSWDRSTSAPATAYRRAVAPRLWRGIRQVQRQGGARLEHHSYRLPAHRFAEELRHLVTMTREEVRPLVLILDLDPPGPRFEHWLPGMAKRRDHYQQVLVDTVADLRAVHGDEVRLVEASAGVVEHGWDTVLPDSIHRTAYGHRLSAELLLTEILDWLGTEPT